MCNLRPSSVAKSVGALVLQAVAACNALLELIRRPEFLGSGLANQLQQFFEKGLADWDISRDGPYFGFEIPGEPGKFFYVWLDAQGTGRPKWTKLSGRFPDALSYWGLGSDSRIVHFIGKDIVYFHALFWPAILKVAGLKLPNRIQFMGTSP